MSIQSWHEAHTHFLSKTQFSSSSIRESRVKAFEEFKKQNFPTRALEDWHYTSLQFLAQEKYTTGSLTSTEFTEEERRWIQAQTCADFDHIFFVNGQAFSLENNVTSINSVMDSVIWNDSLSGATTSTSLDALLALGIAFTEKGLKITIPENFHQKRPIHFIFCTLEKTLPLYQTAFVEIIVEKGAQVTFIESHVGKSQSESKDMEANQNKCFSNSHILTQIKDNAIVNWVRVQNELLNNTHVGSHVVTMQSHCHFALTNLMMGGKLSRHNLKVQLIGENSKCLLNGAYIGSGQQFFDHFSVIEHCKGNNESSQTYKGVLSDQAKSTFTGKVKIEKKAQQARSAQLNNNLLLGSQCEVNSRPILEIYADDVKATHGSTVGDLNADEYFYLQSRGISRSKALEMLSYAFVASIIEEVESKEILSWLKLQMEKAFTRIAEPLWKKNS